MSKVTKSALSAGIAPHQAPANPPLSSRDKQVADAVEAYLAEMEAGRRPPRAEFLRQYPEITEELVVCLDGLDFVYHVAPQLKNDASDDHVPWAGGIQQFHPIGDFHILREIGRGGMGVVYEAEQRALQRHVALKVLPFAAVLDPRHLQRFKNEALAAAQLEHPHIVPVYGVGCDRGVHHYAMRYIEGQSLAQAIDRFRRSNGRTSGDSLTRARSAASNDGQRTAITGREDPDTPAAGCETARLAGLSTQQSLASQEFFRAAAELGRDMARALDYAHQRGVVHRDVKPANIMLDGEGKAWITDFGLAHIESDVSLTMSGDLLGTLRYMSPEQVLAKRVVIDHRTDVYSLGATLYELLTLQPAFPQTDRQELIHRITFEEPPPPRQINPRIPRELETIVVKAMEKNPGERYETSDELADDLQRFLNHEPIKARRATVRQRITKWSTRHAKVVWPIALVLLLMTITLGASTTWVLGAYQQASRAVDESQAVISFLTDDLLAQVDPAAEPDRDVKLRTVLDRAASGIDRRFNDSPLVKAAILLTLGQTYTSLGEYAEAENHLQSAVDIYQRQLGEEHPHTLRALHELGELHFEAGQLQAAERLFRDVLQTRQHMLSEHHPDTLESLHHLGKVNFAFGQLRPAARYFSQVLEAREASLGETHPDTLDVRLDMARYLITSGNLDRAHTHLTATLSDLLRSYGPRHPGALHAQYLLGSVDLQRGRPGQAIAVLESALKASEASLGKLHPHTLRVQCSLAKGFLKENRIVEAEKLSRQALEAVDENLGPDHRITSEAREVMAEILLAQHRFDEAETQLLKVADSELHTRGRGNAAIIAVLRGLREVYDEGGLAVEAAQARSIIGSEENRLNDTVLFADPWRRAFHEQMADEAAWQEQTLAGKLMFIDRFIPAERGLLSGPRGMAFGPDGHLYVACSQSDSVRRFDRTSGEFIDEFVIGGSGGLDDPRDLAFHDAHLYVTSHASDSLLQYDAATGTFVRTLISGNTGGLSQPRGLLFGSENDVYVACAGDVDAVLRFDATTGTFLEELIPTRGDGYVLDEPDDLAWEGADRIVVSDCGPEGNVVLRFDRRGRFLEHCFAPGADGLEGTAGLARHAGGRLFITGVRSNSLHSLRADEVRISDPAVRARFLLGEIADISNDRTTLGETLKEKSPESSSLRTAYKEALLSLDRPGALAFDGEGNLYVSCYGSNEILRFGPGLHAVVKGRLATHPHRPAAAAEEEP